MGERIGPRPLLASIEGRGPFQERRLGDGPDLGGWGAGEEAGAGARFV